MRTIKFRMWNSARSKMHYDIENVFGCLQQQIKFDQTMPGRGFVCGYDHVSEGASWMQFTGLTDKNKKEIYEGDIVKGVGVTSYDKPLIRQVAFDDASARFGLKDVNGNITFEPLKWISFPLEIIGNIHENPELCR